MFHRSACVLLESDGMRLAPDPEVTIEDVERGKRALVKDAAWASVVGALYGGVILVGFALELGATPLHIGLLAAIPFLAQIAQLPAIALIEKVRQRRKIAVLSVGMLLDHLGLSKSAAAVRGAVAAVLKAGQPKPPDLGGNSGTKEMADAEEK